ncbi:MULTISPECIES: sigma-54 interaction domain-containing protein [unclassified Halomonas]|uniref:sigma-54 interaction domain-containing protein n=1 Tax=unclassified Halomonas TaxID=2609666 RepID=UPI0005FC69CA|nr:MULTISPECIES: sigma-54 dependent transcriptional regulator [unclassified Halomonas]MBR9902658.1 sigma-54-dependent Fis family transcriptional regulator [Gammaproteobacteria bacterium]CEP36361.1 ATPase AAA [Halomonas sp. R57-5]
MNQYICRNKSIEHYDKNINKQYFTGSSAGMCTLYETLERLAKSDVPVFLTGESGTGKELCATVLHEKGARCDKPFIAVNCAAIPFDIFESQFFGHLKGTFTGATCDTIGYARAADGGTLFLDEISELDLSMQSKLLRFLQTGQVMPVGSTTAHTVNCRIVCATNVNPLEQVSKGLFRSDLYYRLNVVPVKLLPLRERGRDVIEIAENLLKRYSSEEKKKFQHFSANAKKALLDYSWPGNVRELQNVIRRSVIMHDGVMLTLEMLDLEESLEKHLSKCTQDEGEAWPHSVTPLWQVEQKAIENAIRICNGNIQRAASLLEVAPSTLYRKRQAWKFCPDNSIS